MPDIPDEIRSSMLNILNYLWADEEKDYWEQLPEDREHHVFSHIIKVSYWLGDGA